MIIQTKTERRGMGMYPGDACYDNTRPNWMPYWMDDLSESGCKYGLYGVSSLQTLPAPPGGQPPVAPQTQAQMTNPGAWTPDMADPHNATIAANTKFFNSLDLGTTQPPNPNSLTGLLAAIPWWAWLAGGTALFIVVKK